MRRCMRPHLGSLVLALVLVVACGTDGPAGIDNGNGTDQTEPLFPSQTFSGNFDSGTPADRWGCAQGGCRWDVVSAGPLGGLRETTAGTLPDNFLFQSPDPQALEPSSFGTCERFSAGFKQSGTFAFNYFVQTAGPVYGGTDGNYLEVDVSRDSVEYDPDFEDSVIVSSDVSHVLKETGNVSSRFQMSLPAGHYDFDFCYTRNRTYNIGPDLVQIDNVDTCAGTSCKGEIPPAPRCRVDEGATLVPDLSTLPIPTFTIDRVQGTTDRYYMIIDTDFLEFITGGLETLGPQWDTFRSEIDGVRTETLVDGKTCDVDTRKSLLIEMSTSEIFDFVASTGIISEGFDAITTALEDFLSQAAVNAAIQKVEEKIEATLLTWLAKLIAAVI